jgi:DNA polymerase I-like protein with 3'-5' exonuclease and polymerase domains
MAEFSMQSIVARRFGFFVDKEQQTTFDLHSPLTPEQVAYAAFDTRMPLAIRDHQINEMQQVELLATAQIENDALGAFGDMHLYGLKVDGERWMKRIAAVEERRKGELLLLDQEFIKVVGRKNEQIDFEEMNRRENVWRNGFEAATPEEMLKAEEIRATRDNAKKAVLRAELNAMEKARKELKAAARRDFSELGKKHTEYKKKLEKCEGEAYINYASNDQLLATLKMIRGLSTLTSVDDDHLLEFNDKPFIQTLRKYRKGKKDTGTYGKQWAQTWVTKPCTEEGWVHPMDGRIHATWNQLEAETGRSSSQKPSVMNLPKEDEVRASFICDPPDEAEPEGYNMVTIDMSGCELRIIAELSHATSWIMAFEKGQDVHSVSTEILEPEKWLAGALPDCAYYEKDAKGLPKKQKCKCHEHKNLRDNTKAINFLLCYGGGPAALADDLEITPERAKELMAKHEKAFPDVWDYLEKSGLRAQANKEARDLYMRRRLLPPPDWESAKQWYKDEHADKLTLDEEVQKTNIFNFTVEHLRKPTAEERYSLTHEEPKPYQIESAMKGLWSSIGRRGKNHEVQGTNASIIKRAIGCGFDAQGVPYLWHTLPKYKALLLSMIHDELICQCPKRYGQQVAELVADAFRRAAAEVMHQVKMEAEWHIDDHWQK